MQESCGAEATHPAIMPRAEPTQKELVRKLVKNVRHKDQQGAAGQPLSDEVIWGELIALMRDDPAFTEFEMTADQWSKMLHQFSAVKGARKGVMLHPGRLKASDWKAVEQKIGLSRAQMRTAIALMPRSRLVGLCLSEKFQGEFVRKQTRMGYKNEGIYVDLFLCSDAETEGALAATGQVPLPLATDVIGLSHLLCA